MATTLLPPSSSAPKTVGDKFSTETAYAAGEYCIYKNTLYVFTADKEAGEWDDSVVEATTIAAELSELNENSFPGNWKYIDCDMYPSTGTTGTTTVFEELIGAVEIVALATLTNAELDSGSTVIEMHMITPFQNQTYWDCYLFMYSDSFNQYHDIYFTPSSGTIKFRNALIGNNASRYALRRIYYR